MMNIRKLFRRSLLLGLIFFISFNGFCQEEGVAVSSDNTPIYYRVYGSGMPLLIINGGPGMNSDGFADLAKKLSVNYKAIIYDQRGTGKSILSSLDSSTITLQKMIEDIEALREHLHINTWFVLGHSFGGMLASYYATQHPERIDKLVLSSSGGIDLDLLTYVQAAINSRLTKAQMQGVSYWTNQIANGDTSYAARLKRGINLAPAYLYNKKYTNIIAVRLTQGKPIINQLIWSDMQSIHFDCRPKLQSFLKPVLIIQGKQDIVKASTAEKSHKAFKNSTIVFVDKASHYAWLENPKQYFGAITGFLQKAGVRKM